MHDNYLLNPRAIADVVSQIEGFREDGEIFPGDVDMWLEDHRWDPKYFESLVEESERTYNLWLVEADGAKVLEDLFADLSEYRVAYNKVAHGVLLTRWVCDYAPEDFEELARLIEEQLDRRERLPKEGNGA